jgi:hypothetical protein
MKLTKKVIPIKKEISGYYGDGKGNFYILYKDGSRVPARKKKKS